MRKLFLSVLVGVFLAGIAFTSSVAWAQGDDPMSLTTEVSFLSDGLVGEVITADLRIIPTIPKSLSVIDVDNTERTSDILAPVANTKEVSGVASMVGILCQMCPAIGPISDLTINGVEIQLGAVLLC